jgi:hypothetical protein
MNSLAYIPNFSDEIDHIDFDVIPKLSRKNIKLINYIIKKFKKTKNSSLIFSIEEIKIFYNYNSSDEIYDDFCSLYQKKIIFKGLKNENITIRGNFQILNSLVMKDRQIFITLSKEIIDSFNPKGFFYKYQLRNLIKLKKKNTIIFYKEIVMKLINKEESDIKLDYLKELFSIDKESYTRFFDFEKYVLKPIFNELSFIDEFNIVYEKIKSGNNKTNKILGLKFKIGNKQDKEKEELIKEIISLIKDEISDFKFVYKIISKGIENYGFEYIKENALLSKKYPKKNFDTFLLEAIEKDFSSLNSNEIYGTKNIILNKEMSFANSTLFQNYIYDYIISKNLYYSFHIEFLDAFKNIKNKKNIWFEDKNYKIIGYFSPSSLSFIKIYSNE